MRKSHSPSYSLQARDVRYMPWLGPRMEGVSIVQKHLPYGLHETVYSGRDSAEYIVCFVVSANNNPILGFKNVFEELRDKFGDLIIPVYNLVPNGVVTSWFALYFKRAVLSYKEVN